MIVPQFSDCYNKIQMNQMVQKIKYFVESVPREEGIKGLIKLQQQQPENLKFKPRIACLHLMQMNHDWQGIKKLIVQWKLIKSFGKQLVIRMRKRVGEQPGVIQDDSDIILKQLDRLNDKNWRQFSPKKNFPDYTHLLNQPISYARRSSNFGKIFEGQKTDRNSSIEGGLLSRFSNLQKIDKIKDKELLTKGLFSKQIPTKIEKLDKTTTKQDITQNIQKPVQKPVEKPVEKQKNQVKLEPQPIPEIGKKKQNSNSNSILKKTQHFQNKNQTPSKQLPKKIISIKYGNEKEREKQKNKSDSKDEFSFSAVKARQVQGFSNKKNKGQQLDQSFLNFSNQSKVQIIEKKEQASAKKQFVFEEIKLQNQKLLVNSSRQQKNRRLYTDQQLNLIQINIAPINFIDRIMKAQGIGALDMLQKAFEMNN